MVPLGNVKDTKIKIKIKVKVKVFNIKDSFLTL
jgi:hypothetical protein